MGVGLEKLRYELVRIHIRRGTLLTNLNIYGGVYRGKSYIIHSAEIESAVKKPFMRLSPTPEAGRLKGRSYSSPLIR